MALLYPWATKEYLLWKMSLGQIIMYYNLGIDTKYPKSDNSSQPLKNLPPEQLKELRDEIRAMYGKVDDA